MLQYKCYQQRLTLADNTTGIVVVVEEKDLAGRYDHKTDVECNL